MKKTKIGLDFDGVIAYNPLRVVRAPITFFKRTIFGIRKLTFFVPKSKWQITVWRLIHLSSSFPANGVRLLKQMSHDPRYEFHLITARFNFLQDDLHSWLRRNGLEHVFKTVNANVQNEQPHLFKERMIQKYQLDFFVDDNLNIVNHLDGLSKTKIMWINNIVDQILIKNRVGFPYLRRALERIQTEK